MKPPPLRFWLVSGCVLLFSYSANPTAAQLLPDATLPVNSAVTPQGNTSVISEGTTAGTNLFHSFEVFSVPTGNTAFFNNAPDIQNIISRVTGGSISTIDGLIQANGTANLFLLNPNGIILGRNASLNIGGSFLASTASSLKFADGTEFNAAAPQSASLLTISTAIGLQFGQNPGEIRVEGEGQGIRTTSDLIDTTAGLRVQPNQTLALVGGNLSLEGATLKTAGGRIELGSVTELGLVSLTPIEKGFALGYGSLQHFGNIQLSQQATADASGEGGGDIQVQGRRVILTGGSAIEASTLGSKPGGTLVVNALESVEIVVGTAPAGNSGLFAQVNQGATGAGGTLTVNTGTLLVRDGGEVSVSTFGQGKGGNLTINATQGVHLIGTDVTRQIRSGLFARANGTTGAAGDLTINTGTLLVEGGAQASAGTRSAGNGGNLTVNATQGVQLIGRTANDRFSSGLFAQANPGATGSAGDLTINTTTLLLQDGALIAAGTFGSGYGGNLKVNATQGVKLIGTSPNGQQSSGLFLVAESRSTGAAGDLEINTSTLLVQGGAAVSVSTFGAGEAGNLTVNATDSVQLIGTSSNGRFGSNLFASAESPSAAAAGDLTINTGELLVRDGAGAFVRSLGTGNAGNITVNARSIRLENNATLSANTQSISTDRDKEQATITLRVRDLVLLRDSNITTNATGSNVVGGNINIDTNNLVAVPHEESDISANSRDFRGGNVRIRTQSIFGTQFREALTPESDITATGASSELSGTVEIIILDVDLTSGLAQLPTTPADPTQAIAQGCPAAKGNRFVVTGRGGLPPLPSEALRTNNTVPLDWITLDRQEGGRVGEWESGRVGEWESGRVGERESGRAGEWESGRVGERVSNSSFTSEPLVEATGWVINGSGEVVLIASAPTATPNSFGATPATCPETVSSR